ncbi:MAG TPA: PilZ domain-containing protein [Dongiaceae bacterium]|nr:PilZ domain-containing protein [Dongiaceae bacterium]
MSSVERRRSSRVPFVASAEIIDDEENTRSSSQLSDLSLHGCYVQMANPFPEGTSVTIEIYKDDDFVETSATVAYLQPKKGMGLTFVGMEPQFASILKKWLTSPPVRSRPS